VSKVKQLILAKPVEITVSQHQAAKLLGIRSEAVRRLIVAGALQVVDRGTPRDRLTGEPIPSRIGITLASVEARHGLFEPIDLLGAAAPDLARYWRTRSVATNTDTTDGYPW
jgi:hypothetical protein